MYWWFGDKEYVTTLSLTGTFPMIWSAPLAQPRNQYLLEQNSIAIFQEIRHVY